MELSAELLGKLPPALRIEIEENAMRKDLTQSELAVQQQRILSVIRANGSEQGRRTDLTSATADAQVALRATEIVGRIFGESGRTVERRLAVAKKAKESPKRFGKLMSDMDRTGRVNGPYRRLQIALQGDAIRSEPPPLPQRGPYRVIAADPPWPDELRQQDPSHRGILPYPSMSVAQICAVDVPSIAHRDCILWLWATNHHVRSALQVLDAWGFEQKTILTWAKDHFGFGDWLRGQTEHCLMAVRGNPTVTLKNQTTLLQASVRDHSRKPEEFYQLVESVCPAPRYAYLFSRDERAGWDMHGDEVPTTASGVSPSPPGEEGRASFDRR